MTQISIGDLARSFMMQRQNAHLKDRMGQLVQELSSGRTADLASHLSGSYSYLADVERSLSLLEGHDTAVKETLTLTSTMQDTLARFQTVASELGLAALSAGGSHLPQAVDAASARARGDFDTLVRAMNTTVAGRSLFSGIDTDQPTLADPQVILDDIRTALAGQTDLAGIKAQLDTWFDTGGGGFETLAYQGSTSALAPLNLGDGESVALDLLGNDPAFRVLLKNAAMAALAADPALGFDTSLRQEVMIAAGEGLSFEQQGLVRIRADLGYTQSRADEARSRVSAERTSLQMARTDLLEIDPYEAATELENVQFQLESLYAVTVRMSRLSLTEYLR